MTDRLDPDTLARLRREAQDWYRVPVLSRDLLALLDGYAPDVTQQAIAVERQRNEARAEVERLTANAAKRLSLGIFAVRDHDAYARPFVLVRHADVSGVSGTGIVADGVEFPDGTVALRWRGGNPTSVVFHDNGMDSVRAIHGHGGATEVMWLAEDMETTAEIAAMQDERDAALARIAAAEARLCELRDDERISHDLYGEMAAVLSPLSPNTPALAREWQAMEADSIATARRLAGDGEQTEAVES